MNEVEFSVKYRQRSWNHICWTFDGEIGQASFYFNDHEPQKAIVSVKYQLYGAPKQFLAFGQEPDKFKGGYDQYQLFQGKISRFNWWSTVLSENYIWKLAKCIKEGNGDVVNWTLSSFDLPGSKMNVYKLDPEEFCNPPEKLLFFPGRRRLDQATKLCETHGGWIVAPNSPQENIIVSKMYNQNAEGCQQEGSESIGWLGVKYYNRKYLARRSDKITDTLSFNNFPRYHAFFIGKVIKR